LPFILLPLGIFIGRLLGLTDKGYFDALVLAEMCYGLLSLVYLLYLRKHPTRGIGAQYIFLVFDPIVPLAAIAYEPNALAWLAVVLLVIVTRTGVRYGMRALLVSWGSAATASLLLLMLTIESYAWLRATHASLIVAATLLLGIPLFIPVIRIQNKTRQIDQERVQVQFMSDSLKAKSEFLSRVSHELRSPLQAIISALDVMSMREGQPVDTVLMSRMQRSVAGLNAQLTDLLTLARGESGNLRLSPAILDWARLFEDLTEGMREAAESKGLELNLFAPEQADFVVVDGLRVCQVVENLLSNAVKYTEFGSITLTVHKFDEAKGVVRFDVVDTGIGIASENIELIFKAYSRAGASEHRRDSAGVGLSIVRTLLGYLGGTVEVQSTPGKGSRFTVTIPAVRHDPEQKSGLGKQVLIIDDREDVLSSITAVVSEMGYACDTASSVGAACNLLAAKAYDVVFFDIQMRLKSGAELATDTRRLAGPNQQTKFIAMTASDEEKVGSEWPFNSFARKPISLATLKRLIADQSQIPVPTSR
jgi:signal transduction histidine kinase